MLDRSTELDCKVEKVKELVESFDQQKDEAISRTFNIVSAHFKGVFKELVLNRAEKNSMHTSMDDENDEDDSGKTDNAIESDNNADKKPSVNPSVSQYRGIGIHVLFSTVRENYIMSQLSGGQKSLVALVACCSASCT